MTILVLGAGGQIGRSVLAAAETAGRPARGLTRAEVDVTDRRAVAAAVAGAGAVVNCAAFTAVDRAESEAAAAFAVNATAPGLVAAACAEAGIPLLHLSTDYVFDGSRRVPWAEDDPVRPLSVYGASKAAGEAAVRRALDRHLILRTAWVFSAHGNNFVRTMLRLARTRAEVAVVADQEGCPTPAAALAAGILTMLARAGDPGFDAWGTYHFCGAPATTWFGFAQAIFAGRDRPRLVPTDSATFAAPARRPACGVLDCGRAARVFGLRQPDWRPALAAAVAALTAAESGA